MIGIAALVFASLFTGAAFYINVAEHPARMTLPPAQAAAQWSPAYDRGYTMQASLAVLGGLAGIAAWWISGQSLWLVGALLMIANWPWTLLIIMPVNNRLKALLAAGGGDGGEIVTLMTRWNRLHAVRTVLGAGAATLFVLALLGGNAARLAAMVIPSASAQAPKPPSIEKISMKLYYASGRLSKDIAADPDFTGWNTVIGEGSAEEAADDVLVEVTIRDVPDSGFPTPVTIEARGNRLGKLQILGKRTVQSSMSDQTGRSHLALWLHDVGCAGKLTVTARMGKAVKTQAVSLDCGE